MRKVRDGEGKRVKKITWNTQGVSETTIFVNSAGKLVVAVDFNQRQASKRAARRFSDDPNQPSLKRRDPTMRCPGVETHGLFTASLRDSDLVGDSRHRCAIRIWRTDPDGALMKSPEP